MIDWEGYNWVFHSHYFSHPYLFLSHQKSPSTFLELEFGFPAEYWAITVRWKDSSKKTILRDSWRSLNIFIIFIIKSVPDHILTYLGYKGNFREMFINELNLFFPITFSLAFFFSSFCNLYTLIHTFQKYQIWHPRISLWTQRRLG